MQKLNLYVVRIVKEFLKNKLYLKGLVNDWVVVLKKDQGSVWRIHAV